MSDPPLIIIPLFNIQVVEIDSFGLLDHSLLQELEKITMYTMASRSAVAEGDFQRTKAEAQKKARVTQAGAFNVSVEHLLLYLPYLPFFFFFFFFGHCRGGRHGDEDAGREPGPGAPRRGPGMLPFGFAPAL